MQKGKRLSREKYIVVVCTCLFAYLFVCLPVYLCVFVFDTQTGSSYRTYNYVQKGKRLCKCLFAYLFVCLCILVCLCLIAKQAAATGPTAVCREGKSYQESSSKQMCTGFRGSVGIGYTRYL